MAAETLNTGNEICLDDEAGIEIVRQTGKLLCRQNASIAIAESCTGGLISHMITNVPGSSDYFLLSCVTYSNEAKINLLGVSPGTIKRYGAVHEETAKEMAVGELDAGQSQNKRFFALLPKGLDPAGQYVIAVVDATDAVTETDENNNQIPEQVH